jgi:hypothetical protein
MLKRTIPFLTLALVLASCSKEKSYEEEYKPKVESLSDFPCSKDIENAKAMLYVPMTLGTPREVADANPFYQGDAKMVKCVFNKDGIEILEFEKDSRFADNDLNHMPVLQIPGDYKEFGCTEDAYGDCSNKEEEKTDLEWNEKSNFEADYSSMEVKEVNMLDLTNIDGDSCVNVEGVKVVGTEKSANGTFNIEIEKTYKVKNTWRCIRSNYFNDKLSYSSFKVRFFYSMVSLDQISSKDYEPKEYSIPDHGMFGLFKSEVKNLDNIFDSRRKEIKYLANRWNPNKKELVYYLSKSYNKESNKAILKATMESMEVMNSNLDDAGVNFKLKFVQQTEDDNISPGDLRYNSIVLIDDPLANGLLGYAPTVKNPLTGEIVQGHVNMYGGVLISGTRSVYEQAVDIMEKQAQKTASVAKVTYDSSIYKDSGLPSVLIPKGNNTLVSSTTITPIASTEIRKLDMEDLLARDLSLGKVKVAGIQKANAAKAKLEKQTFDDSAYFDKLMSRKFEGMGFFEKKIAEKKIDDLKFSAHSKNTPEFFPIAGTTKAVYPALLQIPGIKNASGILKRWIKLTDIQKEKIKEIILVNRYVATFVHEMGHSLGLRHNFAGSTDATNFYSDKEAARATLVNYEVNNGVPNVKAPAYSSVMDYAVSEYNELSAFGKYDIAALRFSYTNTLKAGTGRVVPLVKGITIADFKKLYNQSVKDAIVKEAKGINGFPQDVDYDRTVTILNNILAEPSYPQDFKDYIKSILALENESIGDYKFCTDENAGLSSTCNRFDEGTNLYEIAKFRTERYERVYKYGNFRDDKKRFKTGDLDYYAQRKFSQFQTMRDIFEMYDLYAQFIGQDALNVKCSPKDVSSNFVCEINESVKVIGDFFLDLIKTPDLTCAVADKLSPTVVTSLVKMAKVNEDVKTSDLAEGKYILTNCFEPEVKEYFAKKDLVVVGENGKFLNSHRDSHPDFKYADDIAIRGIWSDKAIAMRMLFERRHGNGTNDENHLALIDHPYIAKKFKSLMKHMVMGNKLENPLPFKTEDGKKFIIPYILEADTEFNQIDDDLRGIKSYFNQPAGGKGNLLETLMSQVHRAHYAIQGDAKNTQYEASNYVTIRKVDGLVPEDLRIEGYLFIPVLDDGDLQSFLSAKVNVLGYHMMSTKVLKEKFEKIDGKSYTKVIEFKKNPSLPDSFDAIDKVFFSLSAGDQDVLVQNGMTPGLSYEAFLSFAKDEVRAKNLFTVYEKIQKIGNVNFLNEIISEKKYLIENGPRDLSEDEIFLFEYEADFLENFVNKVHTEEVINYYYNQLKKLKNHIK